VYLAVREEREMDPLLGGEVDEATKEKSPKECKNENP
jgi:hypothetical protein